MTQEILDDMFQIYHYGRNSNIGEDIDYRISTKQSILKIINPCER